MALPIAALMRFAGALGKAGKAIDATSAVFGQIKRDVNAVSKAIDALKGNWDELNDIAFKTARTMALSREQAEAFNQQLMTSTKELAAQFGITAKEIAEFQKNYSEAVGRNIILTKEQISHMAALSKITDSATAQKLIDEFDKVGAGIARATAYTGRLQERAKALGVSPSKATKMMADNIKLAASYSFRNGVNDIEKMALKAAGLRLEMSQVASALDKFQNIEDAITNSAELQLLGGSIGAAFSNPMAVMYQAKADPEAFMENIVNSLKGKGTYDEKTGTVKFDPVTLDIMKAAAKTLGMSAEQLSNTAMASVQNEKVKQELEESGAAGRFTPKELELLQNLSRTNVNDNGKHFVTFFKDGREQTKEISDLTNEELQIAKDSQLTEEQMFDDVQQIKEILERVHGRARETVSYKEQKEGWSEWWATARADVADVVYKPFARFFNNFTNLIIGKQYFSTGGIAKPLHAEEGTIVPGDSYTGDKVPAMLNSGEMVLNPMQQKSMFNMISSLALHGGMFYGINKLGGKFGVGGLGSTMLLANAMGGEDTGVGDIVTAHYIKKAVKNMSPFKESVKEIGKSSETAVESTGKFSKGLKTVGGKIDKFSQAIYSPFDKIGKKLRSTKFAKSVTDYYDTVKNTTYDESRKRSKYYKNGKPIAQSNIKGGKFTKSLIRGKSYLNGALKQEEVKPVTNKAKTTKAKALNTTSKKVETKVTKPTTAKISKPIISKPKVTKAKIVDISGKEITTKKPTTKAAKPSVKKIEKPKAKALDNSTKKTTVKATKAASKAAKTISKASKTLGTVGKAAKIGGRLLGPIGTALTIGSSVVEGFNAKSKYDEKIKEINTAGLTGKEKAIAKDKAEKERNQSIGGSVGTAVGAAAGAALGSILGPLGTMAGGYLGSMAGEWVGKGIGGLFGGNNAKKYENPAHAADGIIVPGNSYTGDKVPLMANSGEMFLDQKKQKVLFDTLSPLSQLSTTVKALPDLNNFMKVLPSVGASSTGAKSIGIGKTDINLNVNGTIKLEGGGKSVDLDIANLINTPEFKRQLADMLTKTLNENSNGGKRNMESERLNMANQYNKTGA